MTKTKQTGLLIITVFVQFPARVTVIGILIAYNLFTDYDNDD